MPALWAAFDDEALRRVHQALLESLPPAEKLATLRWMLPALGPEERVELLAGVRASAPAAAYDAILRVARDALSAEDWQRLASGTAVAA